MKSVALGFGFALLLGFAGCQPVTPPDSSAPVTNPAPPTNATSVTPPGQREFFTRGVIRQIAPGGKTAVIRHEEIPGYMPKMTMELTVKQTNELSGLNIGDEIAFRLVATADTHWIDSIHRVKLAPPGEVPPPSRQAALNPPIHDPELKPSEAMPDFEFLSETGQRVKFSDYWGKALAFTFIFTRCPLPDFCPRMGRQFATAREMLLQNHASFTNWQFLSISFDPDYDRPEVLARYARTYRFGNPDRWLFAVASTNVLERLTPLVDLKLMQEGGSISHNLRTVVLAPNGTVAQVFAGNLWTSAQLAAALVKAAEISETKNPKP
jgi:protein SCO1/2